MREDSPLTNQPTSPSPLDLYPAAYARVADEIRETERFDDPEQWRVD
ncbi:hypothetical protein ABT144_37210 [Streptomyces sp. NPDC002039]